MKDSETATYDGKAYDFSITKVTFKATGKLEQTYVFDVVSLSYFFREMAAPETRATTARAAATPTTSLAPVPGLVVLALLSSPTRL